MSKKFLSKQWLRDEIWKIKDLREQHETRYLSGYEDGLRWALARIKTVEPPKRIHTPFFPKVRPAYIDKDLVIEGFRVPPVPYDHPPHDENEKKEVGKYY